jgi:exopolyphosphatase/guanosine-5'-triphosphate,3'-diphosphate pyrophosphatase
VHVTLVLGAIDAGSNAIRVVVAEVLPNELRRIEAERVPVRLGRGAFTQGELDARTIDEAVAAFVHFRELFDRHQVTQYRAVATSAVRAAGNREVLLHRLHHEAGIDCEVIEGDEEARLVRKAVVSAFTSPSSAGSGGPPPRCILDLGGGSLEVNLRDGQAWRARTLPVGTVRLLETFGIDGALSDAEAGMVRRYAAALIQTVAPRASDVGIAATSGGNADALAKILPAVGSLPGLAPAHAAMPAFDLSALEKALPEIAGISVEARMEKYGVRRDRAEVMGVAALVFATVGRQLGIQRFVAPGVGVREAVLLELAEAAAEAQARTAGAHDKALVTAARSFANRMDHDTTHGEQVRRLASSLFTQMRDIHQLPDDLLVVLEVAALLHDVGEVVNQRGHHKHSEYIIRHGRIPGLDGARREMVALLARCHRKAAADARKLIAESPLAKDQRAQLRRLTALLRLADGLDSEHRQRVQSVVVTRAGDAIVLDLITRDGPGRDDSQLVRKNDLFQDELGLAIRFTVARPIEPPAPPTPMRAPTPDPTARTN